MISSSNNNSRITVDGTICIGNKIVCDGFLYDKPVAIFTHIHEDHIRQIDSALNCCDVYVSKQTKDLLIEIKDDSPLIYRNNLFGLEFDKVIDYDGDKITLFPTKHILGSSQVLVETENDQRIVYTSDFDMPGTKPIECNTLIIDATHGSKEYIHNHDKEKILNDFVDVVNTELRHENPVVIKAHRGQLQELMAILSDTLELSVPFITGKKEKALARIHRKYQYKIRENKDLLEIDLPESQNLISSNNPYVRFISSPIKVEDQRICYIRVSSDIAFKSSTSPPWYKNKLKNTYSFNLSNHADFNGIINYIKETNANLVITDRSRSYYGNELANEIKSTLKNVDAITLP